MAILKLFCFFCLILFLGACNTQKAEKDDLLARYRAKNLYLSDLKGTFPNANSKIDSNIIIQNYTDKWIKNQVFLEEALDSKVLELDEIEAKVQEYRNALIVYEYQKKVISQKLDTVILPLEYENFYKLHEKDFGLKQNIVKGLVIKSKANSNELLKLFKEIKRINDCQKSEKSIRVFCNQFAESSNIQINSWVAFDALVKSSPFNKIQNKTDWLSRNNIALVREDDNTFLIKICDCKLENRISPIDYVKEQIKSIILNSRKVKILEEYEEEIYKKALSEKEIEKFN
ncbi:MAG: hypothetical protein ACKVOU_07045 [Cytophagales bacterium]